jgi:hypothetical protein
MMTVLIAAALATLSTDATANASSSQAGARAICQTAELQGIAVLGFEASYVIPLKGKWKNQKVWLQNSNAISSHFDRIGVPRTMWRRAPLKLTGCVVKGHFGHLSAYAYQLLNVSIGLLRHQACPQWVESGRRPVRTRWS